MKYKLAESQTVWKELSKAKVQIKIEMNSKRTWRVKFKTKCESGGFISTEISEQGKEKRREGGWREELDEEDKKTIHGKAIKGRRKG